MLKRVNEFLESVPAAIIGGAFLVLSFVLEKAHISFIIDPAWVTVVINGIPLLYLAVWRMINYSGVSKISSALLISIAMFAAIAIGDLFAAGEVVFIMAIGEILEDKTTQRAKRGLENLINLAPVQGRKLVGEKEVFIAAEEIKKGDILRILPGETIPADGIIVSGETSVDQSIMTGESVPVEKGENDEVFCGTINRFGAIDIQAAKVGEDSSLQKLIHLVQEAEEKKAPMQRITDKCASWLVPAALIIAVVTFFITKDIVRAVTVLVVFCPCALVLATPTAIMAAIGQAAKHGVIIKSGEALEKMGKADTIAFDKTGTLTFGILQVSDVISFHEQISSDELLALAAAAENKSEHPLGKAIAAFAKEKEIYFPESKNFKMESGKGVSAQICGRKIYCGNEIFLEENGIVLDSKMKTVVERLRTEGKALVLTAENNCCIGVAALCDSLRPQANVIVKKLEEMNTSVVLLTGDNEKTAHYFAKQAGISEVCAQLLPEEKVEHIYKMMNSGKNVCMVGDGVNDAPALKGADIGVAMGSMGSDIAVDAADIALMNDDISKILYLKKLSNAAVRTIKFSITLSMCINFIAVTLSVFGILTPTTGALVHNVGSCFVVLIAALLYDRKFDDSCV